jgi:hypothetical protein
MQPPQWPQPHQSPGVFAYMFSGHGHTAPAFGSTGTFGMHMQPTALPAPAQQQLHSHMQPPQWPQPQQSPGAFSFSQAAAPFGSFNFSTPPVVQSYSWNNSSVSQAAASSSSSPIVRTSFFSGISSQTQSQAIVSSSCSFGSASFSPDLAGCYQMAQTLTDPYKTPISSPRRDHLSAVHSNLADSFHQTQDRLQSVSFGLENEAVADASSSLRSDDVDHSASDAWAPGAEIRASSSTEDQRSRASTAPSEPRLPTKQMKAASKPLQFFTTIVVKSCLYVKEYMGFVGSDRRAGNIFQKVECALRDRSNYPLPPEVSLKDLMAFSHFQGPDESLFDEYCVSKSKPLQTDMIAAGDKWYNNKFTDIRKNIVNRILPKFLNIVKDITGDGQKSG